MLRHIRLATKEEVNELKGNSCIDENSLVYAMENQSGAIDRVVMRQVLEADPFVWHPSSNEIQRYRFVWGLEERMLEKGIRSFYFNVLADDANAHWRAVVEKWGAEPTSCAPEIRYRKAIT